MDIQIKMMHQNKDLTVPLPSHFSPPDAAKPAHHSAAGGLVVDTPPHTALGNLTGPAGSVLSGVPPPYQPVSVGHLNSQSSSEDPQDYLWLANCETKKPEPNR